MTHPGKYGEAGFTLIEIIVAFAVLALGLTLLIGTLSGATRQVRQAGDAGRAGLHAQTLMAEYASALQKPASFDGELDEGRYRWQLRATPWQDPTPRAGPARTDPGAARLLHVQLDIEWAEGGPQERLEVSSLRLVLPAQGSAP
ncbi:MAG: type II secretion system protein [Thermomonas sp.]|jgi:general secretion pathway protein I